MRRLAVAAVLLVMTAVASACGGGGGSTTAGGGSTSSTAIATTVPVPTTVAAPTGPSTDLTLRIADVRLVNSEEADNGMRVLLPAGVATASVTISGLPSPNQVISVCQANDLDSRLIGAACRTPANGDAVTVNLGAAASGVEIIQVGGSGTGPAANSIALDAVTIRYAASSRRVNARLSQISAGEHPGFTLTPASTDGSYRATLGWTVIQVFGGTASNGQIQVLQAGVAANQAQGGAAGVQLDGKLPTPVGDVAIRVQNIGDAAMVAPKLSLLLP
ncbi:MAG: hypothetical protein M3066_03620 [Actinomycetota bacterium]|nr:hypothetical protein [Actinomycetota bacterium]